MTDSNTLTDLDVLRDAVEALREHEQLRQALRASDQRLRTLCRAYDRTGHVWGTAPEHLRRACEVRGML